MRSKTCTLHAISLCLLPLLTAGCLSDNLLSDHPGTSDKPVEIRMKSYIAGSTANTRAGEGVIDKTLTKDLSVKFARVDASTSGGNPTYSATYGTSSIAGTISKNNSTLTFTNQYYQPDGKNTKLIGWYPAEDTYDQSSRKVTFNSIDGETDIMVTPLKEGNKTSEIKDIAFKHLLTQIQIKVYTPDANTQNFWGGLKSITIGGMKQSCEVILPDASSSAAGTEITAPAFSGSADLPLIKKTPTDNAEIKGGNNNAYGESNPLELGVGKDNAKLAGYAMFAPVGAGGSITLTVETANGTAQATATRTEGFVAGQSYVIILKFDASGITPTGTTITEWTTAEGSDTEITV